MDDLAKRIETGSPEFSDGATVTRSNLANGPSETDPSPVPQIERLADAAFLAATFVPDLKRSGRASWIFQSETAC